MDANGDKGIHHGLGKEVEVLEETQNTKIQNQGEGQQGTAEGGAGAIGYPLAQKEVHRGGRQHQE